MKKSILVLTLLFLTWLSAALAQVPLIVEERAGIARSDEPVTLGVPFAEGELTLGTPTRVTDPGRNPVDAQFKTMAVWADGSIKWLKCDFQASLGASSTAQR